MIFLTVFLFFYVKGKVLDVMILDTIISDQEIIDRYSKDRQEAFRLLYCKYSDKLLAVCRRYSADDVLAMDYFHEAMIKINDKLSKFKVREEGSLFRWMSRITVNMIIDTIRKERRFKPGEFFVEGQAQPEPDQALLVPLDTMYDMIRSLTPTRRIVFNLYCIEGESRKEIAKKLGISEDGVSSTLWKARKDLAKMVKDYYKEIGQ